MKKALAANQELNNVNDASFGNVPDPTLGGQRGNHFDYELSAKNHYMGDQHNGSSNAAFTGAKIQQGPITLPSGAVYEGEWRNELREGYGR